MTTMCDVERKAYQKYCQSLFQQIATAEGRQDLLNKAAAFLEQEAEQFKAWNIPDVEANCADFMETCFDSSDFPFTIFPLFFEEWKRQNDRKKELKLMDASCPAVPRVFETDEYEDLDEDQASIMRIIDSYEEPSAVDTATNEQQPTKNNEPYNNGDLPF